MQALPNHIEVPPETDLEGYFISGQFAKTVELCERILYQFTVRLKALSPSQKSPPLPGNHIVQQDSDTIYTLFLQAVPTMSFLMHSLFELNRGNEAITQVYKFYGSDLRRIPAEILVIG